MVHVYAALLGLAVSITGSCIATFLAMCVNGMYLREGCYWLVLTTWLPCVLVGLLFSFVPFRWPALHAVWVAYVVVLFAGSLGTITIMVIRIGLELVNIMGYLKWCWIYAVAFLPLTYPLAWLLLSCIKRMKANTQRADTFESGD